MTASTSIAAGESEKTTGEYGRISGGEARVSGEGIAVRSGDDDEEEEEEDALREGNEELRRRREREREREGLREEERECGEIGVGVVRVDEVIWREFAIDGSSQSTAKSECEERERRWLKI